MLLHIPQVLAPEALKRCRQMVDQGPWADGRSTAGTQSGKVKNNLQLPESSEAAREAGRIVRAGLAASALFFAAALPRRIFPPLFNRYAGAANAFGSHIDNAVRVAPDTGESMRTDLSATLFLSEPAEYEGGELVIEDVHGEQRIKLPAGDMILYPASSVHRVQPVAGGSRVASFFWVESMVREPDRRRLLFDLDMAIVALRASMGDTEDLVRLTGCYHNLLRMWAVP